MVRAYSLDLRERVVGAVLAGQSCRAVSKTFGVSVASVVKWSQRFRATGSAVAKPMAVWHFLKRQGLSFKKTLHASEQDRADVARRREQWKKYQGRFDPSRFVFIDETWAKTNMTRSHGRCSLSQRLVAKVPHGHWHTLTFLGALRHDRITAPCVFDGPINGESFRAYVEQILLPKLQAGRYRHSRQAWLSQKRCGPPVDPQNRRTAVLPAALQSRSQSNRTGFRKLKGLLHKAAERTVEAAWKPVGLLLQEFSAEECSNYLIEARYAAIKH